MSRQCVGGMTPLLAAVAVRNTAITKALVWLGASVHVVDDAGRCVLHYAASPRIPTGASSRDDGDDGDDGHGSADDISSLLREGLGVEYGAHDDDDGSGGKVEVESEEKADLDDEEEEPLDEECAPVEMCVRWLLAAAPELVEWADTAGDTPLHLAARYGCVHVHVCACVRACV
jgi:hypothetical protein